ncbi:hypothetical protein PHLCEN_2v10065 [Hermanssonia centrifuga]|uniref:Uncharacterized protein n=1 Tax=Hermanssonia centrifuga TaxID=98765 RepID=A0A2R6NPR1_9APHY|nr:hypothetical protein PHLCEN_2v10065 [Hermanssonia centrifuga]
MASSVANVARLVNNLVEIDYSGYRPTGRAWVTTTAPEHTPSTITALKRRMVGGMIIRAHSATPNVPNGLSMRSRGKQGRAEAAERGILRGNGPSANFPSSSSGRTVVISGLPGMMTTDALKTWLKSFKLAGSTAEEKEIIKVEL